MSSHSFMSSSRALIARLGLARVSKLLGVSLVLAVSTWAFQSPVSSPRQAEHEPHSAPSPKGLTRLPEASRQPESNKPLGFRGGINYAITSGQVTMNAQEVLNSGPNSSGSLRLELWASPTPYSGGTICCYQVGVAGIATISPNGSLTGISETASYNAPSSGVYSMVLVLAQYNTVDQQWEVVDAFQFPSTQTLGSTLDSASGFANSGGFNLLSPETVTVSPSTVRIQLNGLQNMGVLAFSGLRLEIQATSVHYDQAQSYFAIAEDPIAATIGPAETTAAIDDTVTLLPPPSGAYYLTLVLEQQNGSNWTTLTYVTLSNTVTFPVSGGVIAQPTSTLLASSASTIQTGTSVTFTATVTSSLGTPNGTVNFAEGGSVIGSASLNAAGVATLATSSLGAGTQAISAIFAGNSSWSASTSNTVSVTVNAAAGPPASIKANPSSLPAGSPGTVTLTWSAPNSTSVQIYVNSTSGTLFADGVSSGSQTTGNWATAGMTFVLVDANTKTLLTSVTIQTATGGGSSATISATPNPLPAGTDVVTVNWSAPNSSSVQIFVAPPGGQRQLFADGGPTGTTATGAWASPGMTFYLVDASTQAGLASLTLTAAALPPSGYVIHTIAGGVIPNGVPGTSFGFGAVTATIFGSPNSVAVDARGNRYASFGNLNVVVRIDATTGLMTTIAGNGSAGYNGDNIAATSAELSYPQGVAVDSLENVYIADYGNKRIREVSKGIITTIAGNDPSGYSGDDGPANSADLAGPIGIAVDPRGNVYISDVQRNVVRKISNGIITTIAGNGTSGHSGDGGPATSAQLAAPLAIAVDFSGNLYIADSGTNQIREVSNGIITTIAGNGAKGYAGDNGPATSAQLSQPSGLAVDSAGNLYIADINNNVVRQVSNGIITTIAGNGISGFAGDNGPATAAELRNPGGVAIDSFGNLYIADCSNNPIREVSKGIITSVAGNGTNGFNGDGVATSAELNSARGIAIDSSGNIYISDMFNNRIREISNGVIMTIAGNGTYGYSGDNGPATSAQLRDPEGVAVDSQGSVYIADSWNCLIRKISHGIITTIAGNGTSGYSGDSGPATSAQLNSPRGIAIDAQGTIYIADTGNNRVRKVANGIISTIAGNGDADYGGDNGPATSAAINYPLGVAVDSGGNVYIADTSNNRVREVSNGIITTIAGSDASAIGDNGPATSAAINYPLGVAVDSGGNVYIADEGNSRIRRVSNGIITTIAGDGQSGYNGDNVTAALAQLGFPIAVASDLQGDVYFSDYSNNRVRVLLPQGAVQAGASLSANPDFLPAGPGTATVNWTAPSWPSTALHVNAPGGILFADGGISGSATTGDWATAGMTFYLLDSATRQILAEQTILSDTATLDSSPGALPYYGSQGMVTLTWNAPSSLGVEIHVGSPTGTLFAAGGSSGSAATGNWVTAGMSFYLVDALTHNLLASTAVISRYDFAYYPGYHPSF
jgi:trimeric autotransporter adhesin